MNRRCNCRDELDLGALLRSLPTAAAVMDGSSEYSGISGLVRFYQLDKEVLVYADVRGLPQDSRECGGRMFGFHIHGGSSCSGNSSDQFADAGSHYDTGSCPHPKHAGDLPPLIGSRGRALSLFLTERFTVEEVIGRTVIIHASPDDMMTQPSGNSGAKIACGIITRTARSHA